MRLYTLHILLTLQARLIVLNLMQTTLSQKEEHITFYECNCSLQVKMICGQSGDFVVCIIASLQEVPSSNMAIRGFVYRVYMFTPTCLCGFPIFEIDFTLLESILQWYVHRFKESTRLANRFLAFLIPSN